MTDRVEFFSLRAANQVVDLEASVARVIRRHWYVLGAEVEAFEETFAGYCGAAHGIGVGNGTDALELALRALGVAPGQDVLLAANAGFYGTTSAKLVGARPVYVDVDPETLCLCPRALAARLESAKPGAIIVTHLYGQLAAIEQIADLAERHRVPLVEDVAQAHGARRAGRVAGSFGSAGCFSFYPTKNLGALGDGGAIVCQDDALAARLRALRQYGWSRKYHNDLPLGRNSRLDEMQAAILNDKLPGLDQANAERREIARRYCEAFSALPLLLPPSLGTDFVAHLFVVRTPRRDALREFLSAQGIATDVHFPVPDHRQAVHASEYAGVNLPHTEAACRSVLSLPCYPGMAEADQQKVVSAVRAFFDRAG